MQLIFTKHAKERLFERVRGIRITDITEEFNAGNWTRGAVSAKVDNLYFNNLNVKLKATKTYQNGDMVYLVITVLDLVSFTKANPKKVARERAKKNRIKNEHEAVRKQQEKPSKYYAKGKFRY